MAKKEGSPSDLSKEQVLKLAKVSYYKGAQGIHTMKFRSEFERARYLKCCRDTYLNSQDLLNSTELAVDDFKDDHCIAPAVKTYSGYIKNAIWAAHQVIQMYSQRAVYIAWLKEHASAVLKVLSEHKLSPFNEARIAQFTEEMALLSKSMLKYEALATSPTARMFYRGVRTYGFTFSKLLQRYQNEFGFKGRFKNLGTEQQLQVLDKVIEVTSGSKLIKFGKRTIEVMDKYGGRAVLSLTAFSTAVDIYSADPDKRYETAMKDVVTVGSSILLGELQGLIYAEVAFALVCTGNPALIAAGIAIGVATYFAGNAIQDLIDNDVAPLVLDFMNNHKNEVKLGLEIASFNPQVSLLELAGVSYDKIPRLLKYRPGAFQLYEILFNDKLVVGPSFYLSPLLSLTPAGAIIDIIAGKSKDPVMDLVFSFPILRLFRDVYETFIKPKPNPNPSTADDSAKPKPPPPISTYGLRVRDLQVPDGRVLARQIACKA